MFCFFSGRLDLSTHKQNRAFSREFLPSFIRASTWEPLQQSVLEISMVEVTSCNSNSNKNDCCWGCFLGGDILTTFYFVEYACLIDLWLPYDTSRLTFWFKWLCEAFQVFGSFMLNLNIMRKIKCMIALSVPRGWKWRKDFCSQLEEWILVYVWTRFFQSRGKLFATLFRNHC